MQEFDVKLFIFQRTSIPSCFQLWHCNKGVKNSTLVKNFMQLGLQEDIGHIPDPILMSKIDSLVPKLSGGVRHLMTYFFLLGKLS